MEPGGCAYSADAPSISDAWQGTAPSDETPRAARAAEAALAAPTGRGWISGKARRTLLRRPC
eukprot:7967574-Alexandrium_andersonii.AAC.1